MSFGKKFLQLDPHKKKIYANSTTKWAKIIFRTLFIVGMSYVILYPLMHLLANSFSAAENRFDPTVVWIPRYFSLYAFRGAIEFLDYWNAILRTLLILVPSVIFQVISAMLAGYGFARFKFKGRGLLFGLLIFTIIVPVQTYIIPLFVIYSNMGILDTPVTFWLPSVLGVGIRGGLYIFVFRQFFANMPKELEEAALIDGCGPIRVFIRIMMPNVGSAVLTVGLFSTVWHWNDFYLSSMFYDTRFPISVTLAHVEQRLSALDAIQDPIIAQLIRNHVIEAACLLVLLPLLIFYIFTQRYFTESVQRTGLVG